LRYTAGVQAETSERIYTRNEIRARLRVAEQLLALEQRKLSALVKMEKAAAEIEYVERAMEALDRGEGLPEPDTRLALATRGPGTAAAPALAVLMGRPGDWLSMRDILAGTGRADPQSLRHALRRLTERDSRVQRRRSGQMFLYRYVSPSEEGTGSALHVSGPPEG
jgi:hypothetical protein